MVQSGSTSFNPSPVAARNKLIRWYRRYGRHDLPWRRTADPYAVFVSELMLQQTTVATVIPYYKKFLKKFPNFRRLGMAPLEKVMELWSGLGYYARARHLHAAARTVIRDFGGVFPTAKDDVLALPGVGRYTAGAILSFAFNRPEAVLDGNVIRVLCRIYGIQEDPSRGVVRERLWTIAQKMVPQSGGREINSALMDFGATLCRPMGPDCFRCPLAALCR
ncbi:MAG TPA: A/G-specific adenine glycosylase, partial [Elusimicrobiota bacterium]|nr:A/G-specific adenine glycosylase [Elusimicrobiota bacterium]